jgi:hypothetical protein
MSYELRAMRSELLILPIRFVVVVSLLVLASCGPSEPIKVETIQLGRSLNPDNSIAVHTTRFKPDDTLYVSLLTTQPGFGTLGVRWTYAGRVVSEPTKDVSYRGPAATEFHIANSSGFPEGDYSVEVFVDGQSIGKRDFRVEN